MFSPLIESLLPIIVYSSRTKEIKGPIIIIKNRDNMEDSVTNDSV